LLPVSRLVADIVVKILGVTNSQARIPGFDQLQGVSLSSFGS